jgi:hypothetical protein
MITQTQAFATDIFHDSAAVDPDSGRCVIWRRCNSSSTWPNKPDSFSTPVVNDAGISGAVTEMNAQLFHTEEECPHGYKHGTSPWHSARPSPAEQHDGGLIEDIPATMTRDSLGSRQDYMHRILRRQLSEKLDEIQAALGLSDLQMMEVVARWMHHKAHDLRDVEVDET